MLRVNHLNGFGKRRPTAGSGFDSDAQAFFTATGITDGTIQSAINQLVLDLKSASIWTKMNAIYPFVGGTSAAHAVNLKSPGTFNISWNGTVTHDANGITGDGSTGFGNTGLNAASVLTTNNTHLSVYSRSTGSGAGDGDLQLAASEAAGASRLTLGVRFFGNFTVYMYATGTGSTNSANANGQGFYIGSRRANNDMEAYKNGSSVATQSGSGGALPSRNLYILALNNQGTTQSHSNKNVAFASIGSSLTDTESANFYTAVQAFQTTLGRNV